MQNSFYNLPFPNYSMKFHSCKISFPLFRAQDQVLELISFHDDALKSSNGFITYPSFNHSALEACSQDRIEKLSTTIDSLNPFEEKRDYFATSVLSESENLQFDTEGRVVISEKLLSHAKIKNNALFVGLGKTFQIWEPKNFEKFKVFARKRAFQNRSNLKWENKQKGELS